MKYLKYLICTVLIVAVSACSTDPDLPFDLDGTLESTGAFLRVIEFQSTAFDVGDPDNAMYSFVGEIGDEQNGQLTDRVEFYVSFDDADRIPENSIAEPDEPIKVYNVSDMPIRESSNRPFSTFSITLMEILNYMPGLDEPTDLNIGDRFNVRWVVIMNDGRSFSLDDRNNAVAATSAFRSPYFAQVNVVVSLEEDVFVGSYNFEQQSGGIILGGPLWNSSMEFDASLSVDPDNTLVGRVFTADPYHQFGHGFTNDFPMEFGLFTTLNGNHSTGLTCGGDGLAFGAATENRGSFNPADDSQFVMVVAENTLLDCGAPFEEIEFVMTKN